MIDSAVTKEDDVVLVTIDLGDADDFLSGDIGFDALLDGAGDDILYGEHGLYGERGDAWRTDGTGHDILDGDSGDDLQEGGTRMSAGEDHDFLSADIGFDALLDRIGDDILSGVDDDLMGMNGDGVDRIRSGNDRDTIEFSAGAAQDWAIEFLAGVDTLDLSANGLDDDAIVNAAIDAGASWVDLGEPGGEMGDTVHVAHMEASIFSADDVVL